MKCQHSRWHASKSFTRESCHRVVERHEYGSLLKLHIMQWIWSFPHSSRELLMLKWSAAGKPTSAELQHWMKRTTTGWVMFSHSSAVDYTSTVKGLAQIEFNSCSNFYGYCRQYYRVEWEWMKTACCECTYTCPDIDWSSVLRFKFNLSCTRSKRI